MPNTNNGRTHSSARSADSQKTRKPPPKNDLSGPAGGSGALAEVVSRPEQMSVGDMPVLQRSVGNKTAQRMVAQRSARADMHAVDSPAAQAGIPEDLMTEIETMIESKLGSGRPLDEQTRARVESSLMADLSNVRIHTDADAASMAQSLNAQAFTVGNDIFFNAGMFNPGTPEGDRLLIHELTHVQQQGGGEAQPPGGTIEIDSVSQPGDDAEVVAEQVADQVAAGGIGAGSPPEPQADESKSVADQAQEDASEEPGGDSGGTQSAEKKTKAAQQAKQAASTVNSVGSSPEGAAASAETVAAVVESIVAPGSGISPEGAAGAMAGAALTKETAGVAKEVTQSSSPGEMAGEVAADIAESSAMEQVSKAPIGGGEGSSGEGNTEGGGSSEAKQEGSDAGGADTKQDGTGGGAEKKDEAEDKAKDKEEGAEKGGDKAAGGAPAGGPGGGPVKLPASGNYEPNPEAETATDLSEVPIPKILENGPADMGAMASTPGARSLGAGTGGGGGDSFPKPCTGLAGFGDLFPEMPEGLDYALPPVGADVSGSNAKVEADSTGKGVDKMFKDSALSHSGPSQGLDDLKKTITALDSILQIMDYITYAAIGMLVLAGIGIAIASLPFWQLAYKIPLIAAFIGHIGTFLTWFGVLYFGIRGLSMILRSIMITVMLEEGVHPDLIRSEADTLTNHAIGTLVDAVMAVGPKLYEDKMAAKAATKAANEATEAAAREATEAAAREAAEAAAREGTEGVAREGAEGVAGAGTAAANAAPGNAVANDAATAAANAAPGNAVANDAATAAANAAPINAADDAATAAANAAPNPAAATNAAADAAANPAAVADAAAEAAPNPAAAAEAAAVNPNAAADAAADVAANPAAAADAAAEAAPNPAAATNAAADAGEEGAETAAEVADDVQWTDNPLWDPNNSGAAAADAAPNPAAATNAAADAAPNPAAALDDVVPANAGDAVVGKTTQELLDASYKTVYENTRNFLMAKMMAYTGTAIQNAAKPIGAEGPLSENTLRGGFGLGKAEEQFGNWDLDNAAGMSNTDDRPISYQGQTTTYAEAEANYREQTGNPEAVLPDGSYTILSPSAPDTGIVGKASTLIQEGPESTGDQPAAMSEEGDAPGSSPGMMQLAAIDYQKQLTLNRVTVLEDDIKRKQEWDTGMTEMDNSLTKAGGDLSTTNAYLDQQITNANKAITSYEAVEKNLITTNALLIAAGLILSVGAYLTTDPPIIAMAIMTGVMIAFILTQAIASAFKIAERKDEARAVITNNTKLKADIMEKDGDVSQSARELKTTKERNEEDISEMQERKTELVGLLGTLDSLRADLLEACQGMADNGNESDE